MTANRTANREGCVVSPAMQIILCIIALCVGKDLMQEEFKDFMCNGVLYIASSYGYIMSSNMNKLSVRLNQDGYEFVTLGGDKRRVTKSVHRLIAELFIPTDKKNVEVNHIDCNRRNNRVDNLEWLTHKENVEHSARIGHYKDRHNGEKNGRSKLCCSDVAEIKEMLANEVPIAQIARTYNVGWTTISHIRNGDTWRFVN